MDSIKIELKPRTPSYSVNLEDGGTALVAYANFTRPNGSFSGLGLSLQASPLIECIAPDAADAEMFFRAVALLNAAPKLLEALHLAYGDIQRLPGHTIDMLGRIEAAIALATTHPLHDDDRDHLTDDNTDFGDPDPYLYGDEDTGEDTNVELLQGAADAANEAAAEERLLGGAA